MSGLRQARSASWWVASLAVLHPALPAPAGAAQSAPPAAERKAPVFGAGTAAVVLDVVVRDRRGRTVRGLAAADFEVYEDGARQAISSFRIVERESGESESGQEPGAGPSPRASTAPAAGAAGPPPAPAGASSAIAFVFDRMSGPGRDAARKAALTYFEGGHLPGDFVGVFAIDLALHSLQPFTRDRAAIRAGLEQASSQAPTAFASGRAEARDRLGAVARADRELAALGAGGTTAAGAATVAATAQAIAEQRAFDQLQADMLRNFDSLERDQQGLATTHGLLAVVAGLQALPGRKTIVFFSEGLALPAGVLAQFRSVIAAANRAQVSVYTVDTGGLRAESVTAEARTELMQAAEQRVRQEEQGGAMASNRALTRELERSEDMLRLNPHAGLGQLAEETGGFLVRDTNDAGASFPRIGEDMRFHYVLTYSPANAELDGRFRTVSVKVLRSGAEAQTRKGYFAVRGGLALPMQAHEAPALAQLERSPRPHDFPLGVAALSFPERGRAGLVSVLVEVPGTAVRYAPDPQARQHRADLSVVVSIKDAAGREVDRRSRQYRLEAAAETLEAVRRREVLFYREGDLPPGRYTAEAVAYDALAGQASVGTAELEVPADEPARLRLSSLVLLKRAEKLAPSEQGGANPLFFGEALLYPNLGEPFRKSTMPVLGFFITAYGAAGAPAPRQATVELRQGPRPLAAVTETLGAPDARGRIQHAGAIPLQGIPPGAYVLRVSVGDGAASAAQERAFTVEE